jgi:type I restriction enzyme, S subunit
MTRLADHCEVITKGTTPTTLGLDFADSGVPFLRVQNIEGGSVNYDKDTLFVDEKTHRSLERSQIRPGDVLVSIAGTIGRAGVVPDSAPALNCNQAVAIVRTTTEVFRPFLRHWLGSSSAQAQMRGATVTGTISNLSLAQLGNLKFPLPTLPEQRRIAEVLDRAEALRAKRRATLAQLDTLTESIFFEMFGDPATNPKGWPVAKLVEVAEFFAGSTLPDGVGFTGQANGHFLLKVSDMNLPGNETYLQTCQEWSDRAGAKACTCPPGSVVIPKRGGAIGTNKKRLSIRSCVLDPNLMAIWPKPTNLELRFLFQWFLRLDLASITSGSSVPQLNKRDLAPLVIPVPPLPSQQDFTKRVAAVERLKATYRASLTELDALFASFQHRAFRGEL